MLNEFGSYNGTLDTSKNDLTRKPCERNYCASGLELGRAPNLPDPSTSWNYPYLSNFCNYYSNNSYDLSNGHQYDNQKCGTQFPRNYPQHPSISSTSVLQCCDPRCQLLSEHSKYPFNHSLNNKINQRTKRPKNYYTGILDLPKPPDPVKTDHINKYASCIPYPSLRNDLNSKYSGQQSDYNVPYENTLKPSKHVLLSDTPMFSDYYTDVGKPSYWSKQNLWNRNIVPSHYPTYEQDKGYNQKLPTSTHSQVGASSNNGRGILFNRLLDHRERQYDSAYLPDYYYPKQNQFPKGIKEYGQSCLEQESVYASDVVNNTRLPVPNNSYQCVPTTYSLHYPEQTTTTSTVNSFKENLSPLKPAEKQNEQKTCILDKNPNLDVREFLSTWDDVEDDKLPENTNETQSLQPAPVIVLDCSTLESDVLAKVKEKFDQNITNLEENTTNIYKQFDAESNSTVLKVIENENTVVSPHTSVIQDASTVNVTAFKQLKDCRVDQKFESSHLNSDGFLTWYSSNSKKKDDLSYDLVEMTERLVNTVDKLFNEPEKKNASKICEPQYEPQNNKQLSKFEAVGSENEWNVNLNYKKNKNIDKCSSNSPSSNNGNQVIRYYQNSIGDVTSPFKNYQTVTYDQQSKEQPFSSTSLNENKNISCSLNLSKTSNDFKFSVNYSKQENEYNVSKLQDFSIKYKNANGYPYYQKHVTSKTTPISTDEFYKNNYENYSSCQYDNSNYNTSKDVMANEKECSMNYVEHIDKDIPNETDITLVKADLEKSLSEITHQFSYSKQKSMDGTVKDGSQDQNLPNDMVSNEEIQITTQNLVEQSPYSGVIQKTAPSGVYEEPTCENSLLSMPSLSPPASPQKVPSKSISSINLTLNDVYENNVIFDTEELNSKETAKMVLPESKDKDAIADVRYQPLNLALSRDLKTNNDDQQQHKTLSPSLPLPSISILNEEINQNFAENIEKTVTSNPNISKVDDGYYSIEAEQDDIKMNITKTSDTLEPHQTKKIAAVPYHTCIVSPKQNDEILSESLKYYQDQEEMIPASSCIQDLSTNCTLSLNESQPLKLAADEECTFNSIFRLSEKDNCKNLDSSINKITRKEGENKLEEQPVHSVTAMPVINCKNQIDNFQHIEVDHRHTSDKLDLWEDAEVKSPATNVIKSEILYEKDVALSVQSSNNLIPTILEKPSEMNGTEVKISNEDLVFTTMELEKKYKHKHKKFKLKNNSDEEQNPKLVDKIENNCNRFDWAKEETELHIPQMTCKSIIKENGSLKNYTCTSDLETRDSKNYPEANKFETPEQCSIPFDNLPNFKIPTFNGHSVSENDNIITNGLVKTNNSKLKEADDKLVQAQNLNPSHNYIKLKKRKFVDTNLPMKKRKQDLHLIRMATETINKWSPISSEPNIVQVDNHIDEKCVTGETPVGDHAGLSGEENYECYNKKRYKKEKKLKKKLKKKKIHIENSEYEQNNEKTGLIESLNPRTPFFKRSKSWTQLTEQKVQNGDTFLDVGGLHNSSYSREQNFGRSKTPPPVPLNSINWSTLILSSCSKSQIQSSPVSPCSSNEKECSLIDHAVCSPHHILNDFYDSEKEDEEPTCESVADDDIFNIPSIAPTPNCDLIRDDNIDFETPKSNQPISNTSATEELEECKDAVPSCFVSYGAPTPDCSLKHDDLDDGQLSVTSENQPQYSIDNYKNLPHEFDVQTSKAPSPNFIFEDSFPNEKELSKAPSPYCNLTETFVPKIHHEEQEENFTPNLCSMSTPSSVAPSPNCDIIEGVLFDDSDFGKVNDEYKVNNTERAVAKIHTRFDFDKTFTNDTIDTRFKLTKNSEVVAELKDDPTDVTSLCSTNIKSNACENMNDCSKMIGLEQEVIEKNFSADCDSSNSFFEKNIPKHCEIFSISNGDKFTESNGITIENESNNSNNEKYNKSGIPTVNIDHSNLDKLDIVECTEKVSNFIDNHISTGVTTNDNDELIHPDSLEFFSEVTNKVSIYHNGPEYPDEAARQLDISFKADVTDTCSTDEEINYVNGPKCEQLKIYSNANRNSKSACPLVAKSIADKVIESDLSCMENRLDVTNFFSINSEKYQLAHEVSKNSFVVKNQLEEIKDESNSDKRSQNSEIHTHQNESQAGVENDIEEDQNEGLKYASISSEHVPDILKKNEVVEEPVHLLNDICKSTDKLTPHPHHADSPSYTNEQPINIVIDEDESDPHTVPSLRNLAFTVLADIKSNRNNLEVFFTPDRTEIVIQAEDQDSRDTILSNHHVDEEIINDAGASKNEINDAPQYLNERHYNRPHLEMPDSSIRGHSLSGSKCQCFMISNEEPFSCLQCSLNHSIAVNEENQMDGKYKEKKETECRSDIIDDDSLLFENERSESYFLYDCCIEESFIDQNINFSPKSNINVTMEDAPLFSDEVSEYITRSIPSSSPNTSKFQIKVQLPWHKIFNLGDEKEIECREPKILELGPAQIEVRLSADDLTSLKNSSSNSENNSPVVKVKRLVIQRRQQQLKNDYGFNNQRNEPHSVGCAAASITNSIMEEEISRPCDEIKNEKDARPIPRIPKMVIRKTSYREYKSYLSPNDELQPVVRLFKSKSLDELALKFYGENGRGEATINVNKIERSLTDYAVRYKNWLGRKSRAIDETLIDNGRIRTAEEHPQMPVENRVLTENLLLENEIDVECAETTIRPKSPPKPERHHCLLCHRSYTSHESYFLHVKGRFHRHLELTQRKTIHALYRHFTGHICPRLRPLSVKERKKMKWKPRSANVNHFYHQKTPLQIALHKSVFASKTK